MQEPDAGADKLLIENFNRAVNGEPIVLPTPGRDARVFSMKRGPSCAANAKWVSEVPILLVVVLS